MKNYDKISPKYNLIMGKYQQLTLIVEQKFRWFLPANILWSPRLPIQPWNSVDNFLYGNHGLRCCQLTQWCRRSQPVLFIFECKACHISYSCEVLSNYFQQNQVPADISTQFLFFSLGFLVRLILAKACWSIHAHFLVYLQTATVWRMNEGFCCHRANM